MEQRQRLYGDSKLKKNQQQQPISKVGLSQTSLNQSRNQQPTPHIPHPTSKNPLFLTEINNSESTGSTANYYSVNKKYSTQNSTCHDNKSISFSLPPTELTSGLSNPDGGSATPHDKQHAFNKSLLALVFKEKSGLNLNENVIESLMENEVIETNNRSTPFPNSYRSQYSHRMPTESIASTNANTFNNQFNGDETFAEYQSSVQTVDLQSKRTQSCDFLSNRRKNLLKVINDNTNALNLQRSDLSEYYFKDLSDLRNKFWTKEESVKLVDVKINKTSNAHFKKIERFDIADAYKRQNVSQHLSHLIKKEFEEVKEVNKKPLEGFISMKHFNDSSLADRDEDDSTSSDDERGTEKRVRFNFEPPLASIQQKMYIDLHLKEFELEV